MGFIRSVEDDELSKTTRIHTVVLAFGNGRGEDNRLDSVGQYLFRGIYSLLYGSMCAAEHVSPTRIRLLIVTCDIQIVYQDRPGVRA